MPDKCDGVVCGILPVAFRNKDTEQEHRCPFDNKHFPEFNPMCNCCDICTEQCTKDVANVE